MKSKLLNTEILKKSIHRHVLSKIKNTKEDKKQAVDEILADIKDVDNIAEVPKKDIPISGQPTMYKNKLKSFLENKKQSL